MQCPRERNPFLPHCLNHCLGDTRRQVQHCFHRFRLDQETGESRAGDKIATLVKEANFDWQFIPCHITDIIARKVFEVKIKNDVQA